MLHVLLHGGPPRQVHEDRLQRVRLPVQHRLATRQIAVLQLLNLVGQRSTSARMSCSPKGLVYSITTAAALTLGRNAIVASASAFVLSRGSANFATATFFAAGFCAVAASPGFVLLVAMLGPFRCFIPPVPAAPCRTPPHPQRPPSR